METTSAVDPCAICLAEISRGQAAFVAECSHTFHHRCISGSVAHGHRHCPLCKAAWRDVPALDPAPATAPSRGVVAEEPPPAYADDDPLPEDGGVDAQRAGAANVGSMVLRTHCEFPALVRDESREGFAVVVHARAPEAATAAAAARAPLDLVTVLDVSGSMQGGKLALLKQAMGFVVDNLGPADRLSVVSFSDDAHRVIRLARMTDDGKASAKRAVESLSAGGLTNITSGLRVASQVLAGRHHRNAVTSVILLSDGQDTCGNGRGGRYGDLLPPSFTAAAGDRPPPPIHTFGFGNNHDAAAMHAIAEATAGTFSFIENQEVIQDSFAQCIGGLLSVAVQDARVAVTCAHPAVRVRQVKSGRYRSLVSEDGRAASVDLGELYAGEERRFLMILYVPEAEATEETTKLIKLRCTYRDPATGQAADVARRRRRGSETRRSGRRRRGAVHGSRAGARPRGRGRGHVGRTRGSRARRARGGSGEAPSPAGGRAAVGAGDGRGPAVRRAGGRAGRPPHPRGGPEGVPADRAGVHAGPRELAPAAARPGGGAPSQVRA
ncbi:hypothetical protein ACP70R_011990 [Stipagrostis hirtigluma subsp. patula]